MEGEQTPATPLWRTGVRLALAVVGALFLTAVLAVVLLSLMFGAPGSGECEVPLFIVPWPVTVAGLAAMGGVSAFGLDRLLARVFGGPGWRLSLALGVVVAALVGGAVGTSTIGVFC